MSDSVTMLEIRKIKEENSLRYLQMTTEEMDKEFDESVKWFIERLGRNVPIASKTTS